MRAVCVRFACDLGYKAGESDEALQNERDGNCVVDNECKQRASECWALPSLDNGNGHDDD